MSNFKEKALGAFDAIAQFAEAYNNASTEDKEKIRETFEDTSEKKTYTRGTVIAEMARQGWDDYDMRRVLEKVTTSERAEAAVGMIMTGNYDYYDVCRIIEKL